MVILVQPMYSTQEINSDSNYVVYTNLIRAAHALRPHWSWVVVFPDAQSGFSYEPDGFFDLPNVIRIPQRISPRKMANAITYDGGWYDKLFRRMGINLVWCNLVEIAHHFRNVGQSCYELAGIPVVVAAHNYVIHNSLPYPMMSLLAQLLSQLCGSLVATCNVFNSDHCQQMLMDNAREYLNPSQIEAIEKTSVRIDYGPLADAWPASKRGTSTVPLIAYNHRLQSYKCYRDTFAMLDEISKRIPFRMRLLTNTTDNCAHVQGFPWAEISLNTNRDNYLRALSECDLNITHSVHETFCIAAIESMAFGQPLIARRGVTFEQITNAKALDYPYLANDKAEQQAAIERLLVDHRERESWGDKLREHVMANYVRSLWAQRYVALFERLEAERKLSTNDTVIDGARKLIEKPIQLQDLYRGLTHLRHDGRKSVSSQSFPLAKVLRLAQSLGGHAYFQGGEQWVRQSA